VLYYYLLISVARRDKIAFGFELVCGGGYFRRTKFRAWRRSAAGVHSEKNTRRGRSGAQYAYDHQTHSIHTVYLPR
jgi:hypothetical protein